MDRTTYQNPTHPTYTMNQSLEEWKDIEDYEGLYRISNLGRVFSIRSRKYLRGDPTNGGYLRVTLFRQGRKRFFIAHLVLQAFTGPRPCGLQACHNNGKPDDNCSSNLRWDTVSNNNLDKTKHGTRQEGERNGNSKLTPSSIRRIRLLVETGVPQREVARQFGISQTNVWDIKERNIWSHV